MTKGTVSIHGKEYETVSSRVQRFRDNFPTHTIETIIVERTADEVVIRALISDESGRLLATGFAEEQRQSSTINQTSALENAETSAIGRALAAFGFGGTEYASADEVATAIGQQSKPAIGRAPAPAVRKVTEAQLKKLHIMLRELGIAQRDERLNYVSSVLGKQVESSTDLTLEEASAVIEALHNDLSQLEGEAA